MENPQENKTEAFGFEPNWGLVLLISLLVFLGAFLGGWFSSFISSGIIIKKIKSFFEQKEEQTKQALIKPKGKIVKLNDAIETLQEDDMSNETDFLQMHKKFRDTPAIDLASQE